MKKAYLIDIDIRTRVVAENEDEACKKAIEKIRFNACDYIDNDNITEVEEDTEIPYGQGVEDDNLQ